MSGAASSQPVLQTTLINEFNTDFDIEKELKTLREEPNIHQEEQELTMMLVRFKGVADGSISV